MIGTMRDILKTHKDLLEVGETVRCNHVDCEAGEDTRSRLYITRKPDVLLAYCHNCGVSNSMYMASDERYRAGAQATVRKPAVEYTNPTRIEFNDKANIPAEAEAWRIRNKLSRTDCAAYFIDYAPDWDSIYIPFYDMDGRIEGHQFRPLHMRGGAKYINFQKDKDKQLGGIAATSNIIRDVLVIVEDLVSAIHVDNAGYDALINYGTHVKPTILFAIPDYYKNIVVWLDNDNTVVHDHAKQMESILHLYNRTGTHISRVSTYDDPKHYDATQIKEIIDGHT